MKKKTYEEWKHAIHNRISEEIGRCIYTNETLRDYLGYDSKGGISKLTSFKDDTVPDVAKIVTLANLLNVSVDYLLCVTDERKHFHHDEPVDWKVVEEFKPKKKSSEEFYSWLKDSKRKFYLKWHRSKTGHALYEISHTMTISDRMKKIANDLNNKKGFV